MFSKINITTIEKDLDELLMNNRQEIAKHLMAETPQTWQNFALPLELLENQLSQFWSPISHLHAVKNSDELRKVYQDCLPKIVKYSTEQHQNQALYEAYKTILSTDKSLTSPQQSALKQIVRDFELSGIALSFQDKQKYAQLVERLNILQNQFEQNLLAATDHWHYQTDDPVELTGLPEPMLAKAKQEAIDRGLFESGSGYVLTLEAPCYLAVMMHGENRALRQRMYRAYTTRASNLADDRGQVNAQWDNGPILVEIVNLRQQLARLLQFDHYVDYALVTKMADSLQQANQLLTDLLAKSLSPAREDIQQLTEFAQQKLKINQLNPWDVAYASEQQRLAKYDISEEQIRQYFPVDHVISGMFEIVHRLYGITIKQVSDVDVWHPDVLFYEVYGADQQLCGQFYLDLYARSHKRGGAWMDECQVRMKDETGGIQLPIAFLTCNFMASTNEKPACLTHQDVETLFHEFGHGLHHLLTQMDVATISGINGVPWDAVELPSQLMEQWCWQRESVDLIASHVETAVKIPDQLWQKMLSAKNYHSAMQMVRQIEFSLFDLQLHALTDEVTVDQVQQLLDKIRTQVSVVPQAEFNRFQNSFSHIFAGGYAAGYYSYKWAEVLSSDVFSLFEEKGLFDAQTGQRFLNTVLAHGGSMDPMTLFKQFRGREPKIDALLRHNGVA